MERRTLTVPEVAQMLGLSRNSAYKAAREGQIPGVIRIGERYMVPRSVVEKLLGERLDLEGKGAS